MCCCSIVSQERQIIATARLLEDYADPFCGGHKRVDLDCSMPFPKSDWQRAAVGPDSSGTGGYFKEYSPETRKQEKTCV
jgi:hypothetical protein